MPVPPLASKKKCLSVPASLPGKNFIGLPNNIKIVDSRTLTFFTPPSIPYPLIFLRVHRNPFYKSYSPALADGCPGCLVPNSTFKHQH